MSEDRHGPTGDAALTASGIAELAGVGRAAVSNWRRRYADFPPPTGGTPASPTFNAADVEAWLRRQGRLRQVSAEQLTWRHIESYQPAAQIGDALGITGAYLLAGPHTGTITPKQLVTRLRSIDPALAAAVRRIMPDRWTPQLQTLLRTVDTLAQHQDPETAFEYLHGRYVSSAQSMSGLATTPDPVAEIMLDIAGPSPQILDFTCGTGSILRIAADRALRAGTSIACFGQEISQDYALIALIRLWFIKLRAKQPAITPHIHVGDSLLADAYTAMRTDVVVANFPFGIHDWGHDRLAYDPRWVYGMPPRTEPELAWVQHALAHLSPGGTAVVLMPPAAAVRPAGRRIRAELVRRGALRAVIALPAGLMPPVGIGLHLWVLVQPDEQNPPTDRLLFIDAGHADQSLHDVVPATWHAFREGELAETPGLSGAVPAIAVLTDEVDLTPQRYLPPLPRPATNPGQIKVDMFHFDQLLVDVSRELPAVEPAKSATLSTAPRASLADLVRAGSMTILRAMPRGRTATDSAALTVVDVMAGTGPSGHVVPAADHDEASPRVQAGDILLPVAGREVVARVATDAQVGAALGQGIQALRIDPSLFDPWFVAGLLAREDNVRAAIRTSSAGGGTLRVDLRRLTIPVLTIQEQRVYGEAFRRLDVFRLGLERAAAAGAALARSIGEGLASGALRVDDRDDQSPNRR
ncbi:N-6 DNA methylase [Dactylosporangium sp. CA-139114]|uniref:N-6 DNA methylase n=1 Tax=Dactylosporangium sp. CA-139114 TaxID=3239931 RepID=UPI003D9A06B5